MARKNSRHDRFCREYIKDLNGTRAAIAAGYAKQSARITASRLLTNANISALIASLAKSTRTSSTWMQRRFLPNFRGWAFLTFWTT